MSDKKLKGFNTNFQSVEDKYSWINDMIKQRQELVLSYMKLLSTPLSKDFDESNYEPSYEQVITFCEDLIDYISHGHFDIYPKILELSENASGRSLSIFNRAMPIIDHTTEYLMRFNDKYGDDLNESKIASLNVDLGELGKCLEQRFRAEDRLIIGLKLVHTIVSQA